MADRIPNHFVSDNGWPVGNINFPPTFQPPPYHHVANISSAPNFVSTNANSNFDTKHAEQQKLNAVTCQPFQVDNTNALEVNQYQNSQQQNMLNHFNSLSCLPSSSGTQSISFVNQPVMPPNYSKPTCQSLVANNDNSFPHVQHVPTFNSGQMNTPISKQVAFHNSHADVGKNVSNVPPYCRNVNVPPPHPPNTCIQPNMPAVYNIPPPVRCALPIVESPQDGIGNLQQLRFLPPPFVPPKNLEVHPFPSTLMMVPPPPAYSQIPFLPPPAPVTQSLTANEVSATILNPAIEKEQCLNAFLQNFRKKEKESIKIGPTVVEFRSILKTGFSISRRLLNCRKNLSSLLHCGGDEWNSEMQWAKEIKNELSHLCSFLSNPHNLNFIQKKLRTIKRKRKVKTRLKQEAISARQKREKEREALHQEIDKWVDEIKEKNLKVKREIEMKKEVDKILSEVRRKIHEAKKTVEKLKVFEKLRAARQMNAQQKGLFVAPDHSLIFERKLNAFRELLHKQIEVYEEEERTLRVMLEEEQEGQLEEEVQWRREKLKSLQRKKQATIMHCLFGDTKDPSPEDPLFLFYQHQNAGNCSIKSLVQIRHHWDDHIAENGDPVPQQWVVPLPPSNPSWEAVCQS